MLHDHAGLPPYGLVFRLHAQWVQPVAAVSTNEVDILLGEELAEVLELRDESAVIGVDTLDDRDGGASLRCGQDPLALANRT